MKLENLIIKDLGKQAYIETWQDMQSYTLTRDQSSADQLWLVEHPPVFTQGQAGKAEHVLDPREIPVIQTDRGGQVTYHGPGQLVVYTLIDLRRRNFTIRQLVSGIENAVIATLAQYQINAQARCDAPGVYIDNAKICSLGLRVKRGCSYHGLALNVSMDLEPFARINPCGIQNIRMTQMRDFDSDITIEQVKPKIIAQLQQTLINNETEYAN